jgi:pimeloyl-ACP methyl ester carboxylesterase
MTSRLLIAATAALALSILPAAAVAAPLELSRRTLVTGKGGAIEADAGTLRVPENRRVAGSREIGVPFLRLRSRAAAPRAPLFFLQGGPGSRAVTERPEALDFWLPFLEVADVVLIDQRGTNDSLLTWRWDGPLPTAFFVHADSAARHLDAVARRAGTVFRARGVDLAGYTTEESADDLDALRAALGVERVSLLGFSYGTHLAASYIRRHGERVESAILVGTEGPDQTDKLPWTMDVQFAKVALLAARDPGVAKHAPDLLALYDRVIARLEREPMVVQVRTPAGGMVPIAVGPFGLRFLLRVDVGDASDLVVFPRLLWSIDQGDPSVLAWFVNKRAGIVLGIHGMSQAMDASSGVSDGRRALIAEQSRTSRFADVVNFPPSVPLEWWGLRRLDDAFRAPLVSPVRALFVSGDLDFNTPPWQAEEMRWGMTDAVHLVVANAGHEQTLFQNDTAVPVLVDFLAGKDVSGRRITYPPLRFVPLEGSDPAVAHPAVAR